MEVTVTVRRRPNIADPAGAAVSKALRDLGYDAVEKVRIDRTITLTIDGADPVAVEERVREMCERLLANPVMEDYHIEVGQ
jgi:phosphoribosylformylglycinamidine synthase